MNILRVLILLGLISCEEAKNNSSKEVESHEKKPYISFLDPEDRRVVITVPCETVGDNAVRISPRSLSHVRETMKNWDGRLVVLKTEFSEDFVKFSTEGISELIAVNLESRDRRFKSFDEASDYLLEGIPEE